MRYRERMLSGLLALVLCVLSLAFSYIPGTYRQYKVPEGKTADAAWQLHTENGTAPELMPEPAADTALTTENSETTGRYLVWHFVETKARGYELTLRVLHEGVEEDVTTIVPTGSDLAVTFLPEQAEKITLTGGYGLADSVELFSGEPAYVDSKIPMNIPGLITMLILSAIIWYVVRRWGLCGKSGKAASSEMGADAPEKEMYGRDEAKTNRRFAFFIYFDFAVASGLITAGILFLMRDAYGFNRQLFAYVYAALLAAGFLGIWGWKLHKSLKTEGLFLGLFLIESIMLLLAMPIGHSGFDVDTHYRFAIADSYLGEVYATQADEMVMNADLVTYMKDNRITNLLSTYQLGLHDDVYLDHYQAGISIAHFPGAAGLALGRLLGLNIKWRFLMGEGLTLLLYGVLTYFAIKSLKSGKLVLMMIALFPANVFMAANFNYDTWVWGFSFLGIARFIRARQEAEKQVSFGEAFMTSACLAIACIPKQIYFPLTLIPFFMPKDKVKDRKKYVLACILPMALLLVSLLIRGTGAVGGTGDSRTGDLVNPGMQLQYVLTHPGTYLVVLIRFLGSFLSWDFFKDAVMYFGNLGFADLGPVCGALMVLTLVAVFLDRGDEYKTVSDWKLRIYTVLCYVGTAALVATSFYLIFTPVGLDGIMGVQARYLMPLVWPLLALVYTRPCTYSVSVDQANIAGRDISFHKSGSIGDSRWILIFAAFQAAAYFAATYQVLVTRIL